MIQVEPQPTNRQNLIDRYQKIYSNQKAYGYDGGLIVKQQRLGLFRDYETMDNDSIISSALDIYSDESTMKNEYGQVLDIETTNENIHDILHNLFYDILNIEFNLHIWFVICVSMVISFCFLTSTKTMV